MNEIRAMEIYREITGESEARARAMYIFLEVHSRRARRPAIDPGRPEANPEAGGGWPGGAMLSLPLC